MLDNSQTKAHFQYEMSVPTAFVAQLYFHAVVLLSRDVKIKNSNIVQKAMKRTMVGMVFQLVRKAWDPLTSSCPHWISAGCDTAGPVV